MGLCLRLGLDGYHERSDGHDHEGEALAVVSSNQDVHRQNRTKSAIIYL